METFESKECIIFDFDGTIADTLEIVGEIINELSDEYGYQKKNIEDKSIYMSKSARQFIKEDLKISWWKLPSLVRRGKLELNKKMINIKPARGIVEVILELKSRGYVMGIISSNSEENIKTFISKNNINIFSFISSGSSLFGKARNIKRALRREKLNPENVVYVGDEIRDVDAANKAGVDIIAVSWGYNSRSSLAENHASILIDSPSQLLDLFPAIVLK